MWIGKWKDRTNRRHGLNWVKELPLLGAVFSAFHYSSATWDRKVEKVEKRLAFWKCCSLSIQGKGFIINALALSHIWHLCSVFVMPSKVASHINKGIWSFFWSGGRDLAACRSMVQPRIHGGFGFFDFQLKADGMALQWLKWFCSDSCAKWKVFFFNNFCWVFLYNGVTSLKLGSTL